MQECHMPYIAMLKTSRDKFQHILFLYDNRRLESVYKQWKFPP